MSRVFVSGGTGAAVYVFAHDHCPPHVHARHMGEGWIARVGFSYLGGKIDLLGIASAKKAPLQRVMNQLLDDVHGRLSACRQTWWSTMAVTCLENQWVSVLPNGAIEVISKSRAKTKQIAFATYDPAAERLTVAFKDGTKTEMEIGT